MALKLDAVVEMKSTAEKVWESIRESTTVFPKALPDQYKCIKVLDGDGKSAGSVRLIEYSSGLPGTSFTKERIDFVDEQNKTAGYSVIDGEVLKYYKNIKSSLNVSPEGDGSSVKWCCELEKASEDAPDPEQIRAFAIKTFKDLDEYLARS